MNKIETFRAQADEWTQVVGSATYCRKIPNIYGLKTHSDEIKRYFLKIISADSVDVPQQDIYCFKNAYVSDITLLYDQNLNVIECSKVDNSEIFEFAELRRFCNEDIDLFDDTAAFIFKAGKNNYGHLLIEMLPKIELLLKSNPEKTNLICPTLPRPIEAIFIEVLDEIYPNKFLIHRMTSPLLQVKKLIIPGPVSTHNMQKSALVSEFADKVASHSCATSGSRKVYVSRAQEKNRKLVNERMLELRLSKMGFEIINPQNYSFFDQVKIFSSASLVVGPIGAALSNTIFCSPRTKVVMITPGMFDMFFYDIACLRNLDFSWIFTDDLKLPEIADLHKDWTVDVNYVTSIIEQIMS